MLKKAILILCLTQLCDAQTQLVIVPEFIGGANNTVAWNIDDHERQKLVRHCVADSQKQQNYIDCILQDMRLHNASPQALAFARTTRGWLDPYRQQYIGKVYVAYAYIPGADFQDRYFMITPQGVVIDSQIAATALPMFERQLPELAKLHQQYPTIFITRSNEAPPKADITSSGYISLQFSYILAKCMACAQVATLSVKFNFTKQGKYLGQTAIWSG